MKQLLLFAVVTVIAANAIAQNKPVTRIAKVTIDSLQLGSYKALLKEQMETAIRVEPGVISYTVYADKSNAAILTVMEVYADNAAYLVHRETAHFKKYKTAVAGMVKSLELAEVEPILRAVKENKQ